jgi:cytochrome c-type biogenesis protein
VIDETPTVIAAFGAGVLSVASPAVAPLLPGFVGYVWHRGSAHVGSCLLGMSLAFVALGAGATGAGQALLEHLSLVEGVAGVTLAALGLHDVRAARRRDRIAGSGGTAAVSVSTVIVALVAGAALMFGWTPIAGAVLNRILAIATSADTIDRGLWLLTANAAGRALPLAALALAAGWLLRRATAAGLSRSALQLIAGVTVALTGILIASGLFPAIAAALVPLLPLA